MKQFSDFNIEQKSGLSGDKIKIERILNRKIAVIKYTIKDSKYKDRYDKCLHVQIQLNNNDYVLFSGSKNLIETIQQVPQDGFPFETTIIKQDEQLKFT